MEMKHKINRNKLLLSAMLAIVLVAGSSVTAFAAEDAAASYGYLDGQQQNSDRHALFEEAESFTTDAEREAFFEAQGIGGGEYSTSQHLDAEALVAAGIIDQVTADNIKIYASSKHDEIHARYDDTADMTPDERHALYESFENDGFSGDSIDELLNAGVITQEQADAIIAYLG